MKNVLLVALVAMMILVPAAVFAASIGDETEIAVGSSADIDSWSVKVVSVVPNLTVDIAKLDVLYSTGIGMAVPYKTISLAPGRNTDVTSNGRTINVAVTKATAGASATVKLTNERYCGNGKLEGNEECDDGNNVDSDGCSADCKKEVNIIPSPSPGVGGSKTLPGLTAKTNTKSAPLPSKVDLQAVSVSIPNSITVGSTTRFYGTVNEKSEGSGTQALADYKVSFYYKEPAVLNPTSTLPFGLGKFVTPIMDALISPTLTKTSNKGIAQKTTDTPNSLGSPFGNEQPSPCSINNCSLCNDETTCTNAGCEWVKSSTDPPETYCQAKSSPAPLPPSQQADYGKLICSATVTSHSITGTKQQKVTCAGIMPTAGKWDITMVVDDSNAITETKEDNNAKAKSTVVGAATVKKMPDITVTDAKLSGGKLLITVKNKGTAIYTSPTGALAISLEHLCVSSKGLCVNNPVLTTKCTNMPRGSCTLKIPGGVDCMCNFIYPQSFSVAAGETKELTVSNVPAPTAASKIYVQANGANKITELDTTNNVFTATLGPAAAAGAKGAAVVGETCIKAGESADFNGYTVKVDAIASASGGANDALLTVCKGAVCSASTGFKDGDSKAVTIGSDKVQVDVSRVNFGASVCVTGVYALFALKQGDSVDANGFTIKCDAIAGASGGAADTSLTACKGGVCSDSTGFKWKDTKTLNVGTDTVKITVTDIAYGVSITIAVG